MTDQHAPQPDDLRRPLSELPDPLAIPTLARAFDLAVRPPGSKSITNRALLLAGLARGISTLRGALVDADDAKVMISSLYVLGARTEVDPSDPTTLRVRGRSGAWGIPPGVDMTLNVRNSGTAARFLTAAALLAPVDASVVIDGSVRMRERPIGELVDVMRSIGGRVDYFGPAGLLPLRVWGMNARRGTARAARFGRTSSGQFISAMLMASPWLPGRVGVVTTEDPTSAPYIEMTRRVMSSVGLVPEPPGEGEEGFRFATPGAHEGLPDLPAFTFDIEPDASGASYFWGAAAIVPGAKCRVDGLGLRSIQGDTEFVSALDAMGADVRGDSTWTTVTGPAALRGADIDLSDMPDTAMTAAVVALFASPTPDNPTATTTLRGLRTLRVKETDRLAALQTELTKVGATVEIVAESRGRGGRDESLRITPPPDLLGSATCLRPSFPRVEFDTYDDHRMAMALSLIGLRRPNVWIRDPGCVAKTYPGYFADLAKVYR